MTSEQEQACKFRLPVSGRYRGISLDLIAGTDKDGARYLDWLVKSDRLTAEAKETVQTFLTISWVADLVNEDAEMARSGVGTEPNENKRRVRRWWE